VSLLDWIPWPFDELVERWRAERDPENVAFDVAHGTDTARFDWFGNYEPTHAAVVDEVLDALALDWSRWTFLDLGSGRGRVLLIAAQRPFKRVVGIEVAAGHHRAAHANVKAFGPTVAPVVLLHGDVQDQPLPDGPLALFLYNPFPDDVLERVLARVGTREAVVAYVRPIHAAVVEAAGFVEVARGREAIPQHWRVYRRPPPGPRRDEP